MRVSAGSVRLHDAATVEAVVFGGLSTCPKCGREFAKRRSNQRYCSRACMTADGQRRYRRKA